jgi:hypothetical protein
MYVASIYREHEMALSQQHAIKVIMWLSKNCMLWNTFWRMNFYKTNQYFLKYKIVNELLLVLSDNAVTAVFSLMIAPV